MRPLMLPSPERSWSLPLTRFDVDGAVAAPRADIGGRRQRDEQLRRSVVVELEVESAAAVRLGDRDLEAIAILGRLHLDQVDVVLVAAALLDDHLHFRFDPRGESRSNRRR
jgi:hypothetical protein